MKRLILCSFGCLIWLTGYSQSPMYQADFYFEDALGNRDTITIGYDTTANGEYNPQFGEVNLTQPFDSVFEVRATQRLGFNWAQPPYILSKRIFDLGENYINLPECYGGGSAICFIRAKYPPVTISWDINIMDNLCNRASFWTPDMAWELVDPFSWFEQPGVRYRCASKYESYTIQLGAEYKAQNELPYVIEHAIEGSSNAKDSIYGICFSGFWADWWFSPCSLVDSDEPVKETENLVLFPNPAFDKISFQNEIEGDHWIQIFESTGRLMKSTKKVNCVSAIDVSSLRPGWYILRTVDANGQSQIASFQKL